MKFSLKARLGEHDLSSELDGAVPLDFVIAGARVHPDYSATKHHNDVAVVTLQSEVTFTDKIAPVCLPVAGEELSRINS
jgi:6,7-dimethyl-8-ribityllumazine synthase